MIDLYDLESRLAHLHPGKEADDQRALIREILETSLPRLEKTLRAELKEMESDPTPQRPRFALSPVMSAIFAGLQKHTGINVPILAIYALPHETSPFLDAKSRPLAEALDLETTGRQAKAFETGLPSARVVRLPNANHYVYRSHESEVLREIRAFVDGLPK